MVRARIRVRAKVRFGNRISCFHMTVVVAYSQGRNVPGESVGMWYPNNTG